MFAETCSDLDAFEECSLIFIMPFLILRLESFIPKCCINHVNPFLLSSPFLSPVADVVL